MSMMSKQRTGTSKGICATGTDTPNRVPEPSLTKPAFDGNSSADYADIADEDVDDDKVLWYPMHILHSSVTRAFSVRDDLTSKGFTTYLRMENPSVTWMGETEYRNVPVLCNLIFVKAKKKILKHLKHGNTVSRYLQFISKSRRKPGEITQLLHVPDKQMKNFIDAETREDPNGQRIKLTYTDFLKKEGRKVRIIQGPFNGIMGVVKRVQGHRIIIVPIHEAKIAVGITHVAPEQLEFLSE